MEAVWLCRGRGRTRTETASLLQAVTLRSLASEQPLKPAAAVAHANVSKAGETNHPSVFTQHRGTEILIKIKGCHKSGNYWKVWGQSGEAVASKVGGYSAVIFSFPYNIKAARHLHGHGYVVF